MEPKVIGVFRIMITDAKTGVEIELGRIVHQVQETRDAVDDIGQACSRLVVAICAFVQLYRKPKRLRACVVPKIHNRTRKKQRLTRLQRRAKRQKK